MFWDESGGDFFLDSEARHAPTKSNDCSGSEAKCLGRVASKAGDDINKGARAVIVAGCAWPGWNATLTHAVEWEGDGGGE